MNILRFIIFSTKILITGEKLKTGSNVEYKTIKILKEIIHLLTFSNKRVFSF